MDNLDKVFSFGRKGVETEKGTLTEALTKLYETDDDIKNSVDEYVTNRDRIIVFNDVTLEDRSFLASMESDLIQKLSEKGFDITLETLEEFLNEL